MQYTGCYKENTFKLRQQTNLNSLSPVESCLYIWHAKVSSQFRHYAQKYYDAMCEDSQPHAQFRH
eukprot:4909360-Amphidinium_carterae.1